jgi:thiol-disulfide isomerase/thioredoxin
VASIGSASAQSGVFDLHGRVVGPKGQAEAGAIIAERWNCENGIFAPDGASMVTDSRGRFSGKVAAFRFPIAVMAIDHRGRTGGVVLLHRSDVDGESISIPMSPLRQVRMKVGVRQLPGVFETNAMEIYAVGGPSAENNSRPEMAYFLGFSDPKLPLRLPTGSYRLLVRTHTINYFEHPFEVLPGRNPVDLGVLTATASTEGLLFGHKVPEWHLEAVRGLPENVKVSDFRGKWLLVEGWAYWCVPCVQEGIPELMKFWDAHKDQRDRFAAIAFHTHSGWEKDKVASLADVDRLTEGVKASRWGGREIPVPIVLDKDDETAKLWGIQAIPNVMLIDPNGVLVKTDDPYGYLAARLKE